MESRIRLQKSMQTANTMPQNDQMKNFLREGGPQIQEAYKQGAKIFFTVASSGLMVYKGGGGGGGGG